MIERFIENNREAFDDAPLPEGHSERFERRLKLAARRRRLLRTIRMTAAAAAIFALAYMLLPKDGDKAEQICILSGEMLETKRYYASMLNAAKIRVERIVATAEPEIRRELDAELSLIVSDSASFCNNSDESAAIMIQYYDSKIAALRNIENALTGKSKCKTLNTKHQ
ncbi:MAG: hypothetical protein LBD35_04555 [Prevotellaceae bacterium]|jgi:hypothetical protein|nr:hypothetical protein [Prevotellaceae bacterium]